MLVPRDNPTSFSPLTAMYCSLRPLSGRCAWQRNHSRACSTTLTQSTQNFFTNKCSKVSWRWRRHPPSLSLLVDYAKSSRNTFARCAGGPAPFDFTHVPDEIRAIIEKCCKYEVSGPGFQNLQLNLTPHSLRRLLQMTDRASIAEVISDFEKLADVEHKPLELRVGSSGQEVRARAKRSVKLSG